MARELVIVGAGITGLSLAVHAAQRGLDTTVVEAGIVGGVATQRSSGLVHTHQRDQHAAQLALRGLQHFESFAERYGGPSGFVKTGFAYVPGQDELIDGSFRARVRMLKAAGVETEVLTAPELEEIEPALELGVAGTVAYEPRSGYADPEVTAMTLRGAAEHAGVTFVDHTSVVGLLIGAIRTMPGSPHFNPAAVRGVRVASGETLLAEKTVLCAGAWSRVLAAEAGLDLQVRPAAVPMAALARRTTSHLTVVDAGLGICFRPEADSATLVWRRDEDVPLESPDAELPELDGESAVSLSERLAERMPVSEGTELLGSITGLLDITRDGLPLIGPTFVPGLWVNCGWSGMGFESATAAADSLATWLRVGRRPPDLAPFSPSRELGAPQPFGSTPALGSGA